MRNKKLLCAQGFDSRAGVNQFIVGGYAKCPIPQTLCCVYTVAVRSLPSCGSLLLFFQQEEKLIILIT